MDMQMILMAVVLVTVIGLIGAVILVVASIVMYVPVDERVEQITGVLAGAVELYHSDKKAWKGLMKNAMTADFSWDRSAGEYCQIYSWVTGK